MLNDSRDIYAELSLLSKIETIHGKKVRVHLINEIGDNNYEILYAGNKPDDVAGQIFSLIKKRSILLITNEVKDKDLTMINFIQSKNNIKFEANKTNIIDSGMVPIPEVILTGGSGMDIADLYREGQRQLISMKVDLEEKETQVENLRKDIELKERRIATIQERERGFLDAIKDSEEVILSLNTSISEKNLDLDKTNSEIQSLQEEALENKDEIKSQRLELENIYESINKGYETLISLNDKIDVQEKIIENQSGRISLLDENLFSQKEYNKILILLVVISEFLVATLVLGYVIKKKNNRLLSAKTNQLQKTKDMLLIAKNKAEEANIAKAEFLSLMSHELKTPLQAIIGYAEVIIESEVQKPSDNYDERINDANKILSNSDRLLTLINSLLDLSRIESGTIKLNLTDTKPSSVIEDVVESLEPLINKNNIKVSVDLVEPHETPSIDAEKLNHIITNLIGNSIKFAKNGSILVRSTTTESMIKISVKDDGIGIDKSEFSSIFNKFTTLNRRKENSGHGLGLTIANSLCKMMGGAILVHSSLGEWTEFTVIIPLPILISEKQKITSLENDTEENNRIVMIDDDKEFLKLMSSSIDKGTYEIHTANSAEEGLLLISKVAPAVITLDLNLPGLSGWHVIKSVKENNQLKNTKIAIISMTEEIGRYKDLNADIYLNKPIKRNDFRQTIEELMEK